MGSGVFRPPVNISPSGTPLGEPANRESNVTGLVERRREIPAGQDHQQHDVQRHRACPALDALGRPPVPLERGIWDRDGQRRRVGGDPGAWRPALAGRRRFASLEMVTGSADIVALDFRIAARRLRTADVTRLRARPPCDEPDQFRSEHRVYHAPRRDSKAQIVRGSAPWRLRTRKSAMT